MPEEYVRRLQFKGFAYECRVVENPAPRTEPIVLLGGSFQDMYAFRRLEKPWTELATVITVDLPGSGAADDLPAEYGFDFLAEVLGDLLDQLELTSVNLFAASYGVPIGYRLTQRRPERVKRLMLAGASMEYPAECRTALRAMVDSLAAGDISSAYGRVTVEALMAHPDRPVRKRAVTARLLAATMSAVTEADVPRHVAILERVLATPGLPPGGIPDVPALCFTGEYDTFSTPDRVREVAATIQHGQFALIRESDHLPNLERGKEFSQLVADWFTDRPIDTHDFLTEIEHPAADRVPVGAAH
ncbi:alpha/beta fold hydrolase [Streptomyces sp. SDT5-1]|uniref:alpha/beta fold hydrolase n=1 Tax=Streptomyces sp. SDT5-1 TaxID=3406418 RepID=UPI003FD68E97